MHSFGSRLGELTLGCCRRLGGAEEGQWLLEDDNL